MQKERVKKRNGQEKEHWIFNPHSDDCPICGTRLREVTFLESALNGEHEASCCHAHFQIASHEELLRTQHNPAEEERLRRMFPDDFENMILSDEEWDFVKTLDHPNRILFIWGNYDNIPIVQQAMRETGERYIYVDGKENMLLFNRVNEILNPQDA